MRRLPAVIAALAAATLVLLATPVSAAPTRRSFDVSPELVRAGQEVTVTLVPSTVTSRKWWTRATESGTGAAPQALPAPVDGFQPTP